MRKAKPTNKNLWLLIFFLVVVSILIGGSLALKFLSLVQKSSFDGEHFFVVSFYNSGGTDLVGFDPKNKKISFLHIIGDSKRSELTQILAVPIDGEVDRQIHSHSISSDLLRMIFGYQSLQTNLTILDLGKLAILARTIPQSSIIEQSLSLSHDEIGESIVLDLFIDSAVQKEKVVIEIVNATGRSGLGQRLERLLSHLGANVIAVTTSPKIMKTSSVTYFGEKTYTLSRISSILERSFVYTEKPQLADITIILGEDIINTKRF